MTHHHRELAAGRWHTMTLMEQLGNVGSEVSRALRARAASKSEREVRAFDRALELLDLTIGDPRLQGRRKELCRAREVICDFFVGDNEYGSTADSLDRYFLHFAVAANRSRMSDRTNAERS